MELRYYQQEALDAVLKYWSKGGGNALVDLATGSGKSLLLAALCKRLITEYPGLRVILLTHVKELVRQDTDAMLRAWPQAPVGINSAGLGRRDLRSQVLVASIQSVAKESARTLGDRHLIIVDECFPKGTMVSTPFGEKPIEAIVPGDAVFNAAGVGFVEAARVSKSSKLITVGMSNGQSITCTENHLFFCERGWVKARELARGARLIGKQELPALRRSISAFLERQDKVYGREDLEQTSFLFNLMFEICRECDARSWSQRQDGCLVEADRPQAKNSGREWPGSYETTAGIYKNPWRGLGTGVCRPDKNQAREWLSNLLQDRRCQPVHNGRRRTGWGQSLWEEAGARCEEGQLARELWVESVSYQECGSPETVFNLQVSGHPSYFAGGALVHNCHLIPRSGDGLYRSFIARMREAVPDLRVLGATATPFRLDSGRLDDGKDALFHDTVYTYTIAQGVDDGYLSPLVARKTAQVIDVSNVARRGGEFVSNSLEAAANQACVVNGACDEIVAKGQDRRSWLAFCCGVQHALDVRDALRARGVRAETVTGKTPKSDRDRIFKDFKIGRIQALTGMDVFTTGFDAPGTDLIAMLRPTLSASLFCQTLGRGTRLAPGKSDCLVLDFSGNTVRHGPIDAITVASKSKSDSGRVTVDSVRAKACPHCDRLVAFGVYTCPECGHEWELPKTEPKHTARSDEDAIIMSRELKDKWLTVTDCKAFVHEKQGGKPSMRVDYFAGYKSYSEWVCLEHTGPVWNRAQKWWRSICAGNGPASVDFAVSEFNFVHARSVQAIQIYKDGKYWRVSRRRVLRNDGRVVDVDADLVVRESSIQLARAS